MEVSNRKPFLLAIGLVLLSLVILGTSNHFLSNRIESNRLRYEMREVKAVMPDIGNENVIEDQIQYLNTNSLSNKNGITVFRQWQNNNPSGLVLAPIISKGYNDNITLCIGIYKDGSLSGVRVIQHKETQNLGDQIDQENSDWLKQFHGRSLSNTKTEDWQLKQNGGAIDGISGASITSRAVLNVIHDTLKFYGKEGKKLYSSN